MDELMEGLAEAIGDQFDNYFKSLDNIFTLAKASPMDAIPGFSILIQSLRYERLGWNLLDFNGVFKGGSCYGIM